MKRIGPGFYQETVTRKADNTEVRLTVTRVEKADGMTATNWYFQLNSDAAEDWFPTKAAATAAGRKFAENCYLDPRWGWCLPAVTAPAEGNPN